MSQPAMQPANPAIFDATSTKRARVLSSECWMMVLSFLAVPLLTALLAVGGAPGAHAQAKSKEVDELRRRVEQLEGQLVDLQVVIGTLESLARNPRGNASRGPSLSGGSGDTARLSALETQIRALTAQMERMRSQTGGGGAVAPRPRGSSFNANGFGRTTVTPSSTRDPIGGLITRRDEGGRAAATQQPRSRGGDRGPQIQYETAYGALLRQDYAAAQTGFETFLGAHPRHELSGNAQYWLGEVHFVRRNYNAAARAFLKGYRTYAQSSKAPDSLLKLAMSLDRLGARDDACASFAAVGDRFPNAAGHIRSRAQSELRRLKC